MSKRKTEKALDDALKEASKKKARVRRKRKARSKDR
jgi:hypothetical protein